MTKQFWDDFDPAVLLGFAENANVFEDALASLDHSVDLPTFRQGAWPVLEPGRRLMGGWAIDAMDEHLTACATRAIKRLIINVPPGMMKPVSADEMVLTDRGYVRLGNIRIGDRVLTHRGRFKEVSAIHEQGVLPILEIKTHSGRTLKTAPDHPLLTARGWVKAEDVDERDVLALVTAKKYWVGVETICIEEARLLGYLVGDGSVKYRSKTFTSVDMEMIEDVERCAAKLGFETKRGSKKDCPNIVVVHFVKPKKGGFDSWLTRHGLIGKSSYTKFIPDAVMGGTQEIAANFLSAYFSCDGHINQKHSGGKQAHIAYISTVSERLAQETNSLFLRLGIVTRLRRRVNKKLKSARQGDQYVSFDVTVTDQTNVLKIAGLPNMVKRKARFADSIRPQTFYDGVLFADPIVSIRPAGEGECRCLTVEEDHSFTASDLAVRNSLNTRVFFPAWRWTTNPEDRFLGASYSHRLAVRDNRRCRLLIQSPWFQRHWGDRCRLMEDSTSKERFENTRAGFMYATTIGGTTTGERGNFLIIDDPNNVKTAESEATREEALFWFAEVAPSRLIDQEEDVIIVIQQRVHEQDVTGFALEADLGYEHLCIPMEFESGNPRNPTCIGWVDPRTEENELCFPEMFPRDAVERLKKQLRSWGGDYAVAGQLQQRPAPRGGGLFKKEKVGILEETPHGVRWVRGWDLAATKDGGAYTAGARVGIDPMGRIILDDMFRAQIDADSVEQAIQDYANQDGYDCKVSIPQDPGQSGKGQVASMARRLQGFDVEFSPESGSKADRARPLASQVNAGNFYIVRGDWNRAFMNELGSFPVGRFQDQIDACTRAYSLLLKSDITSKVSFGGDARESVWDF